MRKVVSHVITVNDNQGRDQALMDHVSAVEGINKYLENQEDRWKIIEVFFNTIKVSDNREGLVITAIIEG